MLHFIMSEKHLTNQRFTDFDLADPLLRGIADSGFEFCTPIQAEALPPLLAGQDVAGQAKTGTGKTAAFLIAIFSHLERHPQAERKPDQPRAVVVAPTRELAIQIHKDAEQIGRHLPHKLGLVYGGVDYDKQRRMLIAGVDVLIGTPGRLIDYHKQGVFGLQAVQAMVLDEADRRFDRGFIRDIRFLFRRMPPPAERLNMLFSATLSLRVNELAYEHMNNPQIVKIESEHLTVDQVEECVYFPSNEEKIPLLLGTLKKIESARTLIFVNTKYAADKLERWLVGNDYQVAVLSGDVPQRKRESLLQKFKEGIVPVLVATDVAARGLHIPDVGHVINYDLPQDPEDYVHRVGRTARAGASGDAISFACETYAFSLMDIEAYIGHKIPVKSIDQELLIRPEPPAKSTQPRQSARKTSRKSISEGKRTVTHKQPAHRHAKTPHKEPARSKPKADKQGAADEPPAKSPETGEEKARRRQAPETPAIG
jgi:ATP-dependent RNA helicase RhlB